MTASYPTTVWNGDSENRVFALSQDKAPDAADWDRIIGEITATQTRINANAGGVDPDDTEHSVGTAETTAGLVTAEKGDGAIHKTVITLTEVAMVTADGTTPLNDGAWGATKLYTFPKGHIIVFACTAEFPIAGLEAVTGGGSGLSTTADFEVGIGSTAAVQATQFDLQSVEEDLSAAAMVCALTSKTSDAFEKDTQTALKALDGSTTAKAAYLNMRTVDDADHGVLPDVLKITGIVTLFWTLMAKGY